MKCFLKKVLTVVFLLLIIFLQGQELPDKLLVGYWHNWSNSPNSLLLEEIPAAYDVINLAFATPLEPGSASLGFFPDESIYADINEFIIDIALLQGAGKKVLISIGGANHPIILDDQEAVDDFVTSVHDLIWVYGLDGIDIDLEGSSLALQAGDDDLQEPTTPAIVNLIDALIQLTDLMPDMMLTAAPETAYVQGGYNTYAGIWGAYLPVIHALRDRWTYIHVQHYNTGTMFGSDGMIYEPATADFHVAMADMLLAGFNVNSGAETVYFPPLQAHQVVIGLPASPAAAGSGYTDPETVQIALDYLILGETFGGQYQLSVPEGYPDFRGLMTWSINWDVANDLEFSNAHRAYLDSLDLSSAPAEQFPDGNEIKLLQNYPNPFNPVTTISFTIGSEVNELPKLEIYNIKGQKIRDLPFSPSPDLSLYEVTWNGTDNNDQPVPSGIYLYKLRIGELEQTRKMILLK